MKKKNKSSYVQTPDLQSLKEELNREIYKRRYINILKNTIFSLIVVAAVAVLIVNLGFPVFRIYGSSMSPALNEGELVVAVKTSELQPGDLVVFYIGNKILIKRCIASSGDTVDISRDGTVYVNGEKLDEPYITGKSLGQCDISFPYHVPEGRWFVMGDNRKTSVDSRNSSVGCISEEQTVGKIIFRIWPLGSIGGID